MRNFRGTKAPWLLLAKLVILNQLKSSWSLVLKKYIRQGHAKFEQLKPVFSRRQTSCLKQINNDPGSFTTITCDEARQIFLYDAIN